MGHKKQPLRKVDQRCGEKDGYQKRGGGVTQSMQNFSDEKQSKKDLRRISVLGRRKGEKGGKKEKKGHETMWIVFNKVCQCKEGAGT